MRSDETKVEGLTNRLKADLLDAAREPLKTRFFLGASDISPLLERLFQPPNPLDNPVELLLEPPVLRVVDGSSRALLQQGEVQPR